MDVAPNIINLSIDEIVLIGFEGLHADALRDAVRREVGQAVAASGVKESLVATRQVPRIDAGPVDLAPEATPRVLGARIGQSLSKGPTP